MSDNFLSAVLQGEGDALTLDHLLEAGKEKERREMKKWIVPAALVLMLALAAWRPACVSERPRQGREQRSGETTGTQVLPMGKALEELAEPPALTVSCGWDQITPVLVGERQLEQSGPDGEGRPGLPAASTPDSQEYPVLYTGIPGAEQTEGGG